jgi:predicted phosphoribosyltransferase
VSRLLWAAKLGLANWNISSCCTPQIAAPVASKQAVELIKKEKEGGKNVAAADMVVETVTTTANFVSVSQFYKDFDQATDDKVIEIVSKWRSKWLV